MKDDIILKIKEKEALEVIKIISLIYLVFLFFLALILRYQESVVQSLIIVVFVIVIDALNSGEMMVTEKGISSKVTGFIKYSKIYRLTIKGRNLYIYTRDRKTPHRVTFALSEDPKLIESTYRFVDAKIKRIEEETKDHEEYVEKYM